MMKVSPSDLEINCILLQPPIRGLFIAGVCKLLEVWRGFWWDFCLASVGMRTQKKSDVKQAPVLLVETRPCHRATCLGQRDAVA